jgi:hypothetical protein
MIITENKNKKVIQSHDFEQVNCTIDAEDMRYVASLLRNNYSNTRLAVVREISANALDANLEANSNRPIEIKLPTSMNPTFSVRDFGGGLSQEDVFNLYSKYGKSTKRTSNNYIGAFGIGKFAPLSYGDNFTCVSYNGGLKTSYNIFVDENDDTKIVRLCEPEPSNEPSGLCIEVAVSDADKDEFRNITQKFFKFFPSNEMPKFVGVEENFIKDVEYSFSADDDSWFFIESESRMYGYGRDYSAHVIMGRVAYPLDASAINVGNFIKDESKIKVIKSLISSSNFYLRVPLGSVRLHHSRESLEYNKSTQKELVKHLLVVANSMQKIAKRKLADSEDLFDAKRNYARVINSLPYSVQDIFKNSFEWNGIKIESPHFHRDYNYNETLSITCSSKENDASSRNGFKILSRRDNRLFCEDDSLYLIQDLQSSHGNNLRVRTLMNENPALKKVYIINAMTQDAEDYMAKEWHFDSIDKKHIRYTSKVDKEKPQFSGVRKSNGSRAKVKLFKMRLDKVSYQTRNIDYWENVEQEIVDTKDMNGTYKSKLIYIPIKNYKIDFKEFELDNIFSKMKMLNKMQSDSNKKSFDLYGVRTTDSKKLDKSLWISFHDFYMEYTKKYLLSNIDLSSRVYTKESLDQSNELMSFRRHIGNLMHKNSFKVNSTNDFLNSVCEDFRTYHDTQDLHSLHFINYIKIFDKDWLESNLKVLFTTKELIDNLNLVVKKYPLLVNIGESYSSWHSFEKNDLLKNIQQYISLCDNAMGEGEL